MARRSYNSNGSLEKEPEKVKITKESLKETLHLYSYIKPYRNKFFPSLVFIALSAFTTMLYPLFLGKMIDAAVPGAAAEVQSPAMGMGSMANYLDFTGWSLGEILVLMIGVLAIQSVFSFMRIYLLTDVGERSLADMRRDLYSKLISQPMWFFAEQRVGDLSSRMSSDLSQIQDAISFTLAEFLRGIFTLLIGLSLIFIISTKLALVMLAVVPLIAVVAVVFGMRIRKMARKAQDQLADSGSVVQETFSGITVVKAFTAEARELARYSKSIFAVVDTAISNARYRGAFVSFMIFSVFGAIAFVVWVGASMIKTGELKMGQLTSFVIFSAFVGATFAGFADMFSNLQKTLGATQRVRELLRLQGEDVSLDDHQQKQKLDLKGEVELQDIRFSYPSRQDVEVLKGLSLKALPGQQIALVGPSGAGKSTVASILLRFYEPSGGLLTYDGKPASSYSLSELRSQMALVPQEVILFGGSIRENIAYGKPSATEEEIREAARKANASGFIEKFPEGYDTLVGERGIQLSGGQRQRIAIARAILKDPSILILDEATSSLDSESEQLVQEALDNLMKGRTSFVIAHRLSTIRNADQIVVIDKGRVQEMGSHAELVAKTDGVYKRMIEMQFDWD